MSGWGNDDDASGGGEKKKGCFKCGEEGHMSRDCPTGGGGGDGGACRKCGEEGHFAKDCSLPDKCFKCKKEGHMAADCELPDTCFKCKKEGHKSAECELPDTCFKCKKEGHMAADCELPDTCRKCKKEGHMARDCELPDVCRNCGEEGHMSKDCSKPQMCKRCGEEGHMVRECTQEEKTRQMTDEEGKIREIYVPKEEDDSKLFESAITSGINFSKFDSIPVQVTGENPPSAIKTFSSAGLRPLLLENIQKSGYKVPTPVQKRCLPIVMSGRDLMSCAQTGSGKTAAFLLPILHKLMESQADNHAGEMVQAPQCLVITPTRELAMQIKDEARKFSMGSMMKCVVSYGGTSVGYQLTQLQKGCNILIATPGRLMDFVDKGKVSFENLKYLVLDEADRMLDMGFMPDIERCVGASTMPPKGDRQTLMFSATFPDEIQKTAQDFLTESYLFVTVGVVGGACADVVQEFYEVTKFEKREKLTEILGECDPKDKTLVFVQTKKNADFIATHLSGEGLPTTSIHGFSKCGQFLLSYTQTTTENDSMDLNFSYYYRLHWWVFLPYAKARKVAEVTLFSNQGVNGNLYIAFCQWPGDQSKLVVYGCQTLEGDMPDITGIAPSASVHCYLTTTAVPSLNNCSACVKVANTYDADDVAAAWNSCVRLSCLIHGLTVHTQFDLVPPYPKFEPRISMKRNNTVVLNTGNFLHAVTIDIEKSDEFQSDHSDQHQSSFAKNALFKSSLGTKLPGAMSDLLNPIEVNIGVAEISMSGNGLIGSPAGLVGSPPPSFSPASFVPTSDSENTDAESEASIPVVRKVKKGQIKRKLPFGHIDPVKPLAPKSYKDRFASKSYMDRLETVKDFTDKLSPGRRRNSPTKAAPWSDDDPFKLPVASASYMSGSDRRKRMAEAAYELTDDNFNVDAPETLSTFRRKRLADKKYEFTEDDSSENIVPLTRLRSKKIKEAAEAAAAESGNEELDDVISDVMVNSPSDVMVCVERRLKGKEETKEKENDEDCWADLLDGSSYPELLSPGGCIKKDSNSMSPRVSHALGPMSPRISQAMSPRCSAWTPSEVHCRAQFTRRYIEVDDELISVITDVEDDDLGASTGYHTALPLEVHGSGYTQMYMVSKNKAEQLNLPCVRVQQRSLDLEQFCHETATGLCAAANKKFWFCNDYDVEVVDMDPHSGDVVAVAVVLIQAAIVTKSHGQKYNVSSLSRKQYQAGFKFCWNIDSGQYYVVDSDPLKEISAFKQEPSGVWNPARQAAQPLAKYFSTQAHNVRCLTNDSVIRGISLKAIVDPDNLMAIILNDDVH